MTSFRPLAAGGIALFLAACDRTVITPPGATLTELKGHRIHAGASVEHVAVSMCFLGPLFEGDGRYRVEFDRGPGEPDEPLEGAPRTVPKATEVLRDVKIVVEANRRFAMTAKCSDLRFGGEDPATHAAIALTYCTVTLSRRNGSETYQGGVSIDGTGDIRGLGDGGMQWITQRCS